MRMFISGPYPEIRDELRNSNLMLRKKKKNYAPTHVCICTCINTLNNKHTAKTIFYAS